MYTSYSEGLFYYTINYILLDLTDSVESGAEKMVIL